MSLELLVVTADAAIAQQIPLGPLCDLLAERIVRHLRDRVWVVRLRWDPPTVPSTPGLPPTSVYLHAAPDPQAELALFLDQFVTMWSGEFDLLVLDASALFGGMVAPPTVNPLLLAALAGLAAPARVSYLVNDPQQWHGFPFTVGPVPAGVDLLPTVLLADAPPDGGPGAAWIGLFDQLATMTPPSPAAAAGALVDLVQGVTKFYADGGGTAAGDPARVWPLNAVKLRGGPALTAALTGLGGPVRLDDLGLAAADHAQARRTLARWARAATARRVGLALGGGGALSYVGVALIEAMQGRHIPLDVVSGTSFGSVVAGYYAVRGDAGLAAIVRHWYWAQITVLFGWLTGDLLQLWVDLDLGFADINDLEVNFLPVAADAYTGHAWLLRVGAVGHTCAASGSLPPLSPTYDGDQRLLDGALTAGVPAAFVADAGADLVVGANVVPYPPQLVPDPSLPPPWLWNTLRALDPIRRVVDFARGYGMLFRAGGHAQDTRADVVYPADTSGVDGAAFYASKAIVAQAHASAPLQTALGQLDQRWRDLLRHDERRVRFWWVGEDVYLGGDVATGGAVLGAAAGPLDDLALADPLAGLTPAAAEYLQRIAATLAAATWVKLVIHVDSPELGDTLATAQRDAIRDHLITTWLIPPARLGAAVRHGPSLGPRRVALQVWLANAPLPDTVSSA